MPKPIEVSVQDFRARMAEFLRRVSFGKERVLITYHGKPACALVPLDDVDGTTSKVDDKPAKRRP